MAAGLSWLAVFAGVALRGVGGAACVFHPCGGWRASCARYCGLSLSSPAEQIGQGVGCRLCVAGVGGAEGKK